MPHLSCLSCSGAANAAEKPIRHIRSRCCYNTALQFRPIPHSSTIHAYQGSHASVVVGFLSSDNPINHSAHQMTLYTALTLISRPRIIEAINPSHLTQPYEEGCVLSVRRGSWIKGRDCHRLARISEGDALRDAGLLCTNRNTHEQHECISNASRRVREEVPDHNAGHCFAPLEQH